MDTQNSFEPEQVVQTKGLVTENLVNQSPKIHTTDPKEIIQLPAEGQFDGLVQKKLIKQDSQKKTQESKGTISAKRQISQPPVVLNTT